MSVGVFVGEGVIDGVGVSDGVPVAVEVDVNVGVGVGVGVGVVEAVALGVKVGGMNCVGDGGRVTPGWVTPGTVGVRVGVALTTGFTGWVEGASSSAANAAQ